MGRTSCIAITNASVRVLVNNLSGLDTSIDYDNNDESEEVQDVQVNGDYNYNSATE